MKTQRRKPASGITHWEGLFPAGSNYGGSDNAYVEVSSLLLHHIFGQRFGEGVSVGMFSN